MAFNVGASGAWKTGANAWVGVSGVWKQALKMWVGVGGVWKEFYTSLTVALVNTTSQVIKGSGTATAHYRLDNDGYVYAATVSGTITQRAAWITPATSAPEYECLATLSSGSAPTGTLNTWLSLGSDRQWTLTQSSVGGRQCVFTVQIRKIGTTTVVASATITLRAEVG